MGVLNIQPLPSTLNAYSRDRSGAFLRSPKSQGFGSIRVQNVVRNIIPYILQQTLIYQTYNNCATTEHDTCGDKQL